MLKKGDAVLISGVKGRTDLNGMYGEIIDGPHGWPVADQWCERMHGMHACLG